jgi:hypothetical protein
MRGAEDHLPQVLTQGWSDSRSTEQIGACEALLKISPAKSEDFHIADKN